MIFDESGWDKEAADHPSDIDAIVSYMMRELLPVAGTAAPDSREEQFTKNAAIATLNLVDCFDALGQRSNLLNTALVNAYLLGSCAAYLHGELRLTVPMRQRIKEVFESRSNGQSGLRATNEARQATANFAREEARSRWAADSEQSISLRDMAELVMSAFFAQGKEDDLPEGNKAERIKKWIRPVAPNWATRPGRPKKTP